MDNISKISQLNPYDTAIDESMSIYFSFDSSMADKTVEAEDNFFEREEDRENQGTVIKRSIEMTPMRKTSKSILQEINVFSSTPTQKGSVDQIQLGMAALGLAPLGEAPAEGKPNREENLSTICEKTLETTNSKQKGGEDFDGDKTIDDKKSENVVTVSSSSSSSDSSNALSIIVIEADSDNSLEKSMKDENKENICGEKPPVECSVQISEAEKNSGSKDITSEKSEAPISPVINTLNQGNKENIYKANLAEIGDGKKPNSGAVPKVKKESPYDLKKEATMPKRMSTFRMRKSLMPCEPDLNLNRPSRIETGNKRLSTNSSKRSSTLPTTTSIPRLLLKAIGAIPPTRPSSYQEKENDLKKSTLSRNSMIPPPPKPKFDLGKRQTLFAAPSKRQSVFAVSSNKRLSAIKQKTSSVSELSPRGIAKKSGILKTTFNSSAASRRSVRKSFSTPVGSNSKPLRSNLLPPPVKPISAIKARSKSPKEVNKYSATDPKKSQQNKSATPLSNSVFSCDKCPRIFRLSTSLEAHKLLHGVTSTTAPICKFCDKKFAISKALTNHLLEKCTKIPTSERKKLLFPPTSQNDKSKGGNSGAISNKSGISRQSPQPVDQATLEKTPPDSREMQPPTSSTKGKLKVPPAHSGVYRTPNKPVVCYPCKKNFDHVLGFTEHMVSCHSGSDVDS